MKDERNEATIRDKVLMGWRDESCCCVDKNGESGSGEGAEGRVRKQQRKK